MLMFDRSNTEAILAARRPEAAASARIKRTLLSLGHPFVISHWNLKVAAERAVIGWTEDEK